MSKQLPSAFARDGIEAFQATFDTVFQQARLDAERLGHINTALRAIETSLFDLERIESMSVLEKIALADLLSRTQASTIKNVLSFGNILMNLRTIVGTYDGIKKHTSLPGQPVGAFPIKDINPDD